MKDLSDRAAFEARLRAIGAERYHDRHPFHARLHGGGCTPDEVRAWVVNRWYYQSRIPMKDAARRHPPGNAIVDISASAAWRLSSRVCWTTIGTSDSKTLA